MAFAAIARRVTCAGYRSAESPASRSSRRAAFSRRAVLRWEYVRRACAPRQLCDHAEMPDPKPLEIEREGVLELLTEYEALRTWEVLRSVRSAATLGELASTTGLDQRVLQKQVDLLVRHGLVQSIRARKPRTAIGYRVAVERIVVSFDDSRPQSVQLAMQSSASVRREFERCVERHADPEFHPKVGFRFRQHGMHYFTNDDFAELRRRMLAVVEFLATPRPRPLEPKRARGGRIPPPAHCNQAISIVFEPLVGALLPLPAVWMTPRSKLAQARPRQEDQTGLPGLAPREREVALALADGLSRAHVAERMRVSVHTVSTLARRLYRKLGVSSQAALAARLAGHERRKLGER